jgi:hypothetical protein
MVASRCASKNNPLKVKRINIWFPFWLKVIGVPKSNIEVAKGETSAFKTLHIAAEEVLVYEKLNKSIKTT